MEDSCQVSIFSKNGGEKDTAVFYLCGYNDYFFHHHLLVDNVVFYVVDLPGFGFQKNYQVEGGNSVYSSGKYFNYYDNYDKVYKLLTNALNSTYEKNKEQFGRYKKIYLLGHSTGGHIATAFMSRAESQPENHLFKFDHVILNSPLTRFYTEPAWLRYTMNAISKAAGFVTNKLDLNYINKGKIYNEYYEILEKCMQINYDPYFSLNKSYKSNCPQPVLNGWVNCVEAETQRLMQSVVKINTSVTLLCSFKYGTTTYYNTDSSTNPEYIIQDIPKIYKNVKIIQCSAGHDVFLDPENDGDDVSGLGLFKQILGLN